MRCFVRVFIPAGLLSAALAGCSSGHNGAATDASVDGYGVIVPGNDAATGEGGGDAGPTVETTLRMANASPDLGPVDFCWKATGSAGYAGPVLGGGVAPVADGGMDAGSAGEGEDADAAMPGDVDASANTEGGVEAGGPSDAAPSDAAADTAAPPNALVFGAMSPDVTLPTSGTLDIALVAAGQASCASPKFVGTITLDAGKAATVVIMGLLADDGGPSQLSIVSFTDAPLDPQTARVRIIHAALGSPTEAAAPSLAVSAGSAVITSDVAPRQASTESADGSVDSLGYTTLGPLTPPTPIKIDAVGDAAAMQWQTAAENLYVQTGTAHTGIVVSLEEGALGVMWCTDGSAATGLSSACSLYPATQ